MSTPYSPQHCWMEWLVDVQVASRECDSPVCLHTSRLGTAMSLEGNVCYLIVYHYKSNTILGLPISGFDDNTVFAAYKT